MNIIQSLFINVSIIIAYLCVFSFLLLVLVGINTILWIGVTIAWSELKLIVINKKHRKDK